MGRCATISGKTGSGAALLTGLGWAVEQGFDVINMSLSTTRTDFCADLRDLADSAYFRRSTLEVLFPAVEIDCPGKRCHHDELGERDTGFLG